MLNVKYGLNYRWEWVAQVGGKVQRWAWIQKYEDTMVQKKSEIPLPKLTNLTFKLGKFPEILKKTTKVAPIYKKGSKVDLNNYKPIFLTSNFFREKITHM